MSQHMEFDEMNRGYAGGRDAGPAPVYPDQYAGMPGQKIGQYQYPASSNASAGQRLALAIVSICILVPLLGIVTGIVTSLQGPGILVGLVALGIVCLTIIVVNLAFNIRH